MTVYSKSAKSFLLLLSFATMISLYLGFYKYYIKQDYYVMAQVECDPYVEGCFIGYLDEDEVDVYPYKVIYRISNSIPACIGNANACTELSCDDAPDGACVEYLCDSETDECFE